MKIKNLLLILLITLICGCNPVAEVVPPTVPALEYSKALHQEYYNKNKEIAKLQAQNAALTQNRQKAQIRFVKDLPPEEMLLEKKRKAGKNSQDNNQISSEQNNVIEMPSRRAALGYKGPLALGEPGVTSSLWQESSQNNIFRDHRAFAPMDIITIVVSENSEGKREAETDVKQQSDVSLGITNLFNFERDIEGRNTGLDSSNLVNAASQNDFKGKGKVTRKGSLKGTISAMVVEVLPSGILRIEGEKIVAVNGEEQIMVISGLVRPRDINSANEISSSKIANLRIDYFGKGTVGESQRGGWLGRALRKIWPF